MAEVYPSFEKLPLEKYERKQSINVRNYYLIKNKKKFNSIQLINGLLDYEYYESKSQIIDTTNAWK